MQLIFAEKILKIDNQMQRKNEKKIFHAYQFSDIF